jgi:DHA1 family bicyclomycin/chloramphenicol resistance-like MFS transporter
MVAIVLILFSVPETLPVESRKSFHPAYVLRTYLGIVQNIRFMALVLSLATGFAGLFLYIAGAPTVIFDFLGMGSNDFWVQFIPVTAGILTGSWIASRLIHALGTTRVVNTAFLVIGLGCMSNIIQLWWLPTNPVTVILPIVIYATGLTMAMPGITISALDCFAENRGAAAAMQSCNQMIINAVVASVAVPLLSGKLLYFVAGQACCFLAAWGLWRLSNSNRPALT